MAWKVESSSASRLTVTRCRPASASRCARSASSDAFVVSVRSSIPSIRREHGDQGLEIATHERLAAGQAHLAHAQRDRRTDHAFDLLEVEDLGAWQEGVVRAEDLLRHAVHASEVAAVGDADTQVAHRPAEGVEDGQGVGHRAPMVAATVEAAKSADQLAGADGDAEHHGDAATGEQRQPRCGRFAAWEAGAAEPEPEPQRTANDEETRR